MKIDGFHASKKGGKQVFAISLVLALLVASLAATTVFAAPPKQDGGPGGDDGSGGVTANQIRELQAAQSWFNNFRTQPGKGNSARISQYLDQYAFALGQANAVLVGNTGANNQGEDANVQGNTQSGNNFSAKQNMNMWLHMLRGLREKIAAEGGGANSLDNSSGNNNAGIPVTGGSEDTGTTDQNSTPDNNANTGNSAATPASSDPAGTTTDQNSTQGASLEQTWGSQWRELQSAQAWFNNFRTQPGQDRNSEHASRYLDQYAVALQQAYALIAGGVEANSLGDQQLDAGLTNSQSDRTPAQQQLAQYLKMMRSLREKISRGGDNVADRVDTNNAGTTTTP